MAVSLERPHELSAPVPRIRLEREPSDDVVLIDGRPFSGLGYVSTDAETYRAVRVVEGRVASVVDDPLLPSGPFLDLSVEAAEPNWDPDTPDWWHRGRPLTGWSVDFVGRFVRKVVFVDKGNPVDRFEFDESGVLLERATDRWFESSVPGKQNFVRQVVRWAPSGNVRSIRATFDFGEESRFVSGSLSITVDGELQDFVITDQYLEAIATHRDLLSLPFIEGVDILDVVPAAETQFSLGLGERSEEVVDRLLSGGRMDRVETLQVRIYPGGLGGLRRLYAVGLPSLKAIDVTPAAQVDESEVLDLAVRLKRERRDLQVSIESMSLWVVSELRNSLDNAVAGRDPGHGFYFDEDLEELVGIVGVLPSDRWPRLCGWVQTSSSLRFFNVTLPGYLRDLKNAEFLSQLQLRPEVTIIGPFEHPSDWIPELLQRLG